MTQNENDAHTATAGDGGLREALRRAQKALKPFADRVFNDNGDISVTDTYRCGLDEFTGAYFAHRALDRLAAHPAPHPEAALAQAPAVQAPAGEGIASPGYWNRRQAECLQRRDAEHDAAWIDRLRRHFLASPTPTDAQPKDARPVGDEALKPGLELALKLCERARDGGYLANARDCCREVQKALDAIHHAPPTTGQETVATPRDGGGREALNEDQQAEWIARIICKANGNDPEELTYHHNGEHMEPYGDRWVHDLPAGRAVVAALSAPGSAGPGESRDAIADRMQRAFPDLSRLDAECAAEAAFPECLRLATPSPAQEPGTGDTGGLECRPADLVISVRDAPIGTLAPSIGGGRWYRTERGWMWNGPYGSGSTFPRPGGDWDGSFIVPATPATTAGTRGPAEGAR